MAATSVTAYGVDVVEELATVSERLAQQYPDSVFFSSKLVFPKASWIPSLLHNQTAYAVRRRLHFLGLRSMILPMRVEAT